MILRGSRAILITATYPVVVGFTTEIGFYIFASMQRFWAHNLVYERWGHGYPTYLLSFILRYLCDTMWVNLY